MAPRHHVRCMTVQLPLCIMALVETVYLRRLPRRELSLFGICWPGRPNRSPLRRVRSRSDDRIEHTVASTCAKGGGIPLWTRAYVSLDLPGSNVKIIG